MDGLAMLGRARAELERRVPLALDRLHAPTPCEGWTVRDLLQHVVVGNRLAEAMLDGRPPEAVAAARAALTATDQLHGDPVRAFAESADAQAAAFARPGALESSCASAAGDIPASQLLTIRLCDLAVHAWDLARAIGADEDLDPAVVEYATNALAPMAEALAAHSGAYGDGPSAQLPEGTSPLHRLLDLTGRRP